jgi:hypothetical protein
MSTTIMLNDVNQLLHASQQTCFACSTCQCIILSLLIAAIANIILVLLIAKQVLPPMNQACRATVHGQHTESMFDAGCCPGHVCLRAQKKRPSRNLCDLHTAKFSANQLAGHVSSIGKDGRQGYLHMKEEDFLSELDGQLRQTLRVCSECRSNVTRAFREVCTLDFRQHTHRIQLHSQVNSPTSAHEHGFLSHAAGTQKERD